MKQSPPPPSSSPGLKGQRHRWYSLRDEDPRGAFATAVIGATYKGHAAPRHPPVNLPSDATPDGDEDAGSPSIRPVLARGAIAWLRSIEGPDEPDFFARLCRLFLGEAGQRITRMSEALGRGDARVIEDEAHTLRSTSATLGASEMSELCERAEHAAREGRLEGLQPVLHALSVQYQVVASAIAEESQRGRLPRAAGAS